MTPLLEDGEVTVPNPCPPLPLETVKVVSGFTRELNSTQRAVKSQPSSKVPEKPKEAEATWASSPVSGIPSYPSPTNVNMS